MPPAHSAVPAARNPFMLYNASLPFRVSPSGPLSTSSKIASNVDRPDRIKWPTSEIPADPYARIRQAVAEEFPHRSARPCHHRRTSSATTTWAPVRARRSAARSVKPIPNPPINISGRSGLNSLASECRERLLGAAEPAVHQFVVAEPDREFGAARRRRSSPLPPGTPAVSSRDQRITTSRNLVTEANRQAGFHSANHQHRPCSSAL